jgi:hypothetical protein
MTQAVRIPVFAEGTGAERAAVAAAGTLLAEALGLEVECAFPGDLAAVDGPAILVTVLSDAAERADEPWPQTEARLRARYEVLSQDPARAVFICTIFRHVGHDLPPDEAKRRRVRIRRLNLLALELSRELGVMVADVDRDLSDIGGLAFATDYRLAGPYAVHAAGRCIAMAIAHVGLDEFASIAAQDTALERLRAYQPPRAADAGPAPLKLGGYVRTVRANQRVQTVEYAEAPVDDELAATQFKRLLGGRIGVKDAAALLRKAVATRGVKQSATLVFNGLWRMAGGRLARR